MVQVEGPELSRYYLATTNCVHCTPHFALALCSPALPATLPGTSSPEKSPEGPANNRDSQESRTRTNYPGALNRVFEATRYLFVTPSSAPSLKCALFRLVKK